MLEKIKEHEDTYDSNNIRDFVDLYIQSSRENKDETKETFTSNAIIYLHYASCELSINKQKTK